VLQTASTATGELAVEEKKKLEELYATTKAKVEEIVTAATKPETIAPANAG
jgi:hypothetical protein